MMGILMEAAEVKLDTARYQSVRREPQLFSEMGAPGEFYADTFHTIAINTRETEFGSIVQPIPITLKKFKPYQQHVNTLPINGYAFPTDHPHHHQTITSLMAASGMPEYVYDISTSSIVKPAPINDAVKHVPKINNTIRTPPKKKWIKDYFEEEPKSPVSVRVVSVGARSNGLVRAVSPLSNAPAAVAGTPPDPLPHQPVVAAAVAPLAVAAAPAPALAPAVTAPLLDFAQEHSRPRTTSNNSHGCTRIPSPPSVSSTGSGSGSSGSAPRAGTREVHNKLEKNRRAHLKECFELLKRQLPTTPEEKKTSNLSILGSAIRYIQVLRRKERECEHEMERLAREKIAAQQRLAALKREVTVRAAPAAARPRTIDPISDEKDREEHVNGQILGISIGASPPRPSESPPHPHSLNLSTKLRTLPIQITPTTSQQVVRTSYGARHNTLTLTTLAPADGTTQQNGQPLENGVTNALSTTLVHPAQIHLPLSQVVSSGGLVVSGAAIQLVSTSAGLRVVQAPASTNGVSTGENNRIPKTENGIIATSAVSTTDGSVVVNGLSPLVVSQPAAHLLHTHTLTHKMVETAMVQGAVSVSAQYVAATAIVKPVVVVSPDPDRAPPP